jgi:hypothetical protein
MALLISINVRGHHQEVAGDVDVQPGLLLHGAQHLHVGHVRLGDARDGDVVDVQFVPLDQEQQEVKRAVVDVEFNAIFQAIGLVEKAPS